MNSVGQSKKSQQTTRDLPVLDLLMSMHDEESRHGLFLIDKMGMIIRADRCACNMFEKSTRFMRLDAQIFGFSSETDPLLSSIIEAFTKNEGLTIHDRVYLGGNEVLLKLKASFLREADAVLVSFDMQAAIDPKTAGGTFYKEILDQLPADIALFNSEHQYIYVNKKAVKDPATRKWLIGKDDFQYFVMKGKSTELAEKRRALFLAAKKDKNAEVVEQADVGKGAQSKRWRVRRIISAESPALAGYYIGYGIDITEIEEERIKYRQILDSLNDGVIQTDQNFVIQYANKAWNSLVSDQQAASQKVLLTDIILDDDKHLLVSLLDQFSKNPKLEAKPIRLRMKGDEEPVWVEIKISCMPASSSGDCAFYAIIKNIQEEVKSEGVIQKLTMAIENSIEGVAVMNNKDQYTYLNKSHIEMFGYTSEEEILGKSWRIFYPEGEIERIEKEVFPVFMQQGYFRGPTKGLKKDGSIIFQDISLTTLPDGGLICVTHDVSPEIEHQKQIAQLALVAEKTNSIVLITDPFGRIDWVNKSFEVLTGYSIEEIKGLRPSEFLTGPETDPAMVREIQEIIKEGKHFKGEILNYDRSGKKFWLYIDVTPLRDETGQLTGFIAVENNITAIKNAEEKAVRALKKEKQLNQMKSHFVNLVSHEFRTPLATIQSSMDILNYSAQKADENLSSGINQLFSKHQQRIETEIIRMTKIMDNALMLGRLDAGKMLFNPEEIFIDSIVLQMAQELNSMPGNNRVVECLVIGKRTKQWADPVLLRHILLNLVSNALKYSEGRPDPRIEIHYLKDRMQLDVIDFGMGIPENEVPNLFKSFYRASNSVNISGTGLGLVIIKQLIDIHKGRVYVKSNHPSGSIFSIEIPYFKIIKNKPSNNTDQLQ